MSIRSSIFVMGALVASTAQASEVTIICDLSKIDGNGHAMHGTREYILDDAHKSMFIIRESGQKEPVCRSDRCDLKYTSTFISFKSYWKARGDERSVLRFSLNRLSGRLIEHYDVEGASALARTPIYGTCKSAIRSDRKF